jgi:type VI secretion system protein ImpF
MLTAAIARHEPRLAHVRARLVEESGMVNRLSFAISGQLCALANDDRVQFDIMLEPSSLQYAIR